MADGERGKNISEAVKNWVVAIGVIVGGGWALYQFSALLERENAQLEVAQNRYETELNRLQVEEARQRRQIQDELKDGTLQIDVVTRTEIEDGRLVVLGAVEIENVSAMRVDISLDPEKSSVQIRRLISREGAVLSADPKAWRPRDHKGPIAGITALPGRQLSIPFAFWVDAPGIYLITFEAEVADATAESDEILRDLHGLDGFVWQESRIIRVAPPVDWQTPSPAGASVANDG